MHDCVGVIIGGGPTHWWTPAGQILEVLTPVTPAALTPMSRQYDRHRHHHALCLSVRLSVTLCIVALNTGSTEWSCSSPSVCLPVGNASTSTPLNSPVRCSPVCVYLCLYNLFLSVFLISSTQLLLLKTFTALSGLLRAYVPLRIYSLTQQLIQSNTDFDFAQIRCYMFCYAPWDFGAYLLKLLLCKEFIIRLRSGVFVKGLGGTSLRGLRNSWGKDTYTVG